MKRFFFAAIAASALLVPAAASAQVKTVYIPGAHPRVVVVPQETARLEKAPLTPAQEIVRHEAMAAGYRANPRVNYGAIAHCDRMIAEARTALRKNF